MSTTKVRDVLICVIDIDEFCTRGDDRMKILEIAQGG
jgi:hypothetical protein